jgi:predicted lipoprotein with Yx(FWY)xxD motif
VRNSCGRYVLAFPKWRNDHVVSRRWRPSSASIFLIGAVIALSVVTGPSAAYAAPRQGTLAESSTLRSPLVGSSTSGTSEAKEVSKDKLLKYAVTTRNVSGLGTILVDGKGRTLYVFNRDHHSGISKCYDECADGWPPLLLPKGVTKPVAAGGAKSSLLSTTRRTDGSLQVTYKGWPLYRFALDDGPGDALGQGLHNVGSYWYVLKPSGSVLH